MIVDTLQNWQQNFSEPIWCQAFEFLQGLTADSVDGDYPLQGEDLFGRVMSYHTRTPDADDAVLEAHREYVDIQTTLSAPEGIDWFPRSSLEVKTPYDAEKDVEFYHRPGPAPAHVNVYPGFFAVLFPEDAHMPQLIVNGQSQLIKKAVVKVRLKLVGSGFGKSK